MIGHPNCFSHYLATILVKMLTPTAWESRYSDKDTVPGGFVRVYFSCKIQSRMATSYWLPLPWASTTRWFLHWLLIFVSEWTKICFLVGKNAKAMLFDISVHGIFNFVVLHLSTITFSQDLKTVEHLVYSWYQLTDSFYLVCFTVLVSDVLWAVTLRLSFSVNRTRYFVGSNRIRDWWHCDLVYFPGCSYFIIMYGMGEIWPKYNSWSLWTVAWLSIFWVFLLFLTGSNKIYTIPFLHPVMAKIMIACSRSTSKYPTTESQCTNVYGIPINQNNFGELPWA